MSDARVPFVGDFRELEQGSPDRPSLRSAIKAEASANAHELVEYLRCGVLLAATTTLVRDVLSPGKAVIGGLHLLTVDPQFIVHVQANGWTVPQLDDGGPARIAGGPSAGLAVGEAADHTFATVSDGAAPGTVRRSFRQSRAPWRNRPPRAVHVR
ncbi:hypothetical protein ACWGJB_40030 [Streptomyces sp. NPDC054813]